MLGHKRQWPEECFSFGKNSMAAANEMTLEFFDYFLQNHPFAVQSSISIKCTTLTNDCYKTIIKWIPSSVPIFPYFFPRKSGEPYKLFLTVEKGALICFSKERE